MNFCKTLNYGTMIVKLFHILKTAEALHEICFLRTRCKNSDRVHIPIYPACIQSLNFILIQFTAILHSTCSSHSTVCIYTDSDFERNLWKSHIVSPFLIYFQAILSLHLKNVSVDEGYITFTVGSDSHSVFQNLHKYLSSKTTD